MNGKIMSLTFFIIVFSFLVAGIFVIGNILSTKEKELGNQAMLNARTVAKLPEVTNQLSLDKKPIDQAKVINDTIEGIRIINKAEYIVVLNMDHIRLSHPEKDLIGTKSKTSDENAAFAEHYYLSKAQGEVGKTIRAFVPIMNDKHQQIGVVIVGYRLPTIPEILYSIRKEILIATLLSLLFGAWGAWLLGRNMKKQMFNLEPHEIAKMYTERTETFNAMHEGIITIDNDFTVTIFNTKAKQILGITDENLVGKKIFDILPDTRLPEILDYNQPVYNKELFVNQHNIMSNRVPIIVAGKTVGAIAIFQDRTEFKKLAEELTGVKEFVQALRIQNHEHKNKIHTIAGLIQLGHYQQALSYIKEVKESQDEIANFLNDRIKNQNISGLLLSKINHGKELGIDVEIDMNSQLTKIPEQMDFNDFVVIIGNLIENAFEALQLSKKEDRKVMISIDQDEDILSILVEDNGIGMSDEVKARIFDNGYSTKNNENHGIGLYLIQDIVKKLDGTIEVTSTVGEGTSIFVTFYL
ncbi:ATP-binding protein [Rummeliibacillus sp. JY-2-4R]